MTDPCKSGVWALVVLLAAVGPTGCKRRSESVAGNNGSAGEAGARPSVDAARPPELIAVLEDVRANCEVTARGEVHHGRCRVSGLLQQLRRLESAAGPRGSVATYCKALVVAKRPLRLLLSARIGKLANYSQMNQAADGQTFDCLAKALVQLEGPIIERHLARALALMGPALQRTDDVLSTIARVGPAAKQAAYGALWANGRVDALPTLEKAILERQETTLRLASIRGFGDGPRMNAEERRQVCDLLAPVMTDEEQMVAATAAMRVAADCPQAKDAVVRAARQMLARGTVAPIYVRALSTAAEHYEHKASRPQRARIVTLLVKLLHDSHASDQTRSAALRAIYRLDRPRAERSARRLTDCGQPVLRKTAERILSKS